MPVETILWTGDSVRIIDQTKLPEELAYLDCRDVETMAEAIESLRIRGAPAIGIAAAYGVALGVRDVHIDSWEAFEQALNSSIDRLARTRPTAVNLFWALDRMRRKVEIRSQRSEVGGQKSEVRRQKTEVKRQKPEDRS
jgi:methylthioribose-1-phosphate isomerase